jgi:hypothetical protein
MHSKALFMEVFGSIHALLHPDVAAAVADKVLHPGLCHVC